MLVMLMQIMQLPPGSQDIVQGGRRDLSAGAGWEGRDPNKDLAERRVRRRCRFARQFRVQSSRTHTALVELRFFCGRVATWRQIL
jgi:hypothetical protein